MVWHRGRRAQVEFLHFDFPHVQGGQSAQARKIMNRYRNVQIGIRGLYGMGGIVDKEYDEVSSLEGSFDSCGGSRTGPSANPISNDSEGDNVQGNDAPAAGKEVRSSSLGEENDEQTSVSETAQTKDADDTVEQEHETPGSGEQNPPSAADAQQNESDSTGESKALETPETEGARDPAPRASCTGQAGEQSSFHEDGEAFPSDEGDSEQSDREETVESVEEDRLFPRLPSGSNSQKHKITATLTQRNSLFGEPPVQGIRAAITLRSRPKVLKKWSS